MVGGGTKDKFLSELTADSLGIEVSSGPVEATSYGNIAIQLIADGEIRDIETARKNYSRFGKALYIRSRKYSRMEQIL